MNAGTDRKSQHICTLVHGEALHKFDLMFAEVENENPLTVETIILGLGAYFFLLIFYKIKSAQYNAE